MKLSEKYQKNLVQNLAVEVLNSNHLNTIGLALTYMQKSQDPIDPEFHFIDSPLEGKELEEGKRIEDQVISAWKEEEFPFPVIIEDLERRVRYFVDTEKWADLYEIFGYHSRSNLLRDIIFEQMTQAEKQNIDSMI